MLVWQCEACGREVDPSDQDVNIGGECEGENSVFGLHAYVQIVVSAVPDTIPENILNAG
jgi:hypothetical protein